MHNPSFVRRLVQGAITMTVLCLYCAGYFIHIAEAWGSRGMAKPWWLDVTLFIYFPAMIIPIVGPLLVGLLVGTIVSRWSMTLWDWGRLS